MTRPSKLPASAECQFVSATRPNFHVVSAATQKSQAPGGIFSFVTTQQGARPFDWKGLAAQSQFAPERTQKLSAR